TPRLPGADRDLPAVRRLDRVLDGVGERDGVLVVGLAAAVGRDAGLVHAGDVPRPFDRPLDAAAAAGLAGAVGHGGDDEVFGVRRPGRFERRNVDSDGLRVGAR